MSTKPPHKLLKCKFRGSAKTWANKYNKDFLGLGNYEGLCLQGVREGDIHAVLGTVAIHHLGHPAEVDHVVRLQAGCEIVVDYFTGDWWKDDKDARWAMDKSKNRRGLYWFRAYAEGILLLLLAERFDDADAVSRWVEADLKGEDTYIDQEKELPDVYKCIASTLRSDDMPGIDKIVKRLGRCTGRRSKMLFNAWRAARDGDADAYSAGVTTMLKEFHKRLGERATAIEWLATHESVIILTAKRLGMELPELLAELLALVIRPESIA